MIEPRVGQRDAEERRSHTTRLQIENYQLGLGQVRNLTPSEGLPEATKKWFLWKIIDVNPERCIEEAGSMLQSGQRLSHAPAQVLKMYRHDRVRGFLTSAVSDAVFVEAPFEGDEMSRCSPMSLACAMLLQDVTGYSQVAAVHYFCGAHNSIQDPVSGGLGIARILIGQLLCLQEFDYSFLDEEWGLALDQGKPYALLQLFEALISQLRISTIFCVIDAINLFEGNTWRDDAVALISQLLHVVHNCRHLVHFKLLVTSASKSRFIAPMFRQGDSEGLVRLQVGDRDLEVSMRAVKLEIARNRTGLSSEARGSIDLLRGHPSEEAH